MRRTNLKIIVDYIIKSRSLFVLRPRRSRGRQLGETQKDLLLFIGKLFYFLIFSKIRASLGPHSCAIRLSAFPTKIFVGAFGG
jgi:hypothetical protein